MKRVKLTFLLLLILMGQLSFAQDYKFHSVFIYNFTKYIQWPSSYQSGDFIIGVMGKSDITTNLQKMAEVKTVGSQKIVVKNYNTAAEVGKCHILFIPSQGSGDLENIIAQVGNNPTLVITERPGLGKKGSGINFILQSGKWKFELNRGALEASNLKVSGELAKLAIVI